MGPYKAPGPDGFPAIFYQQNWSTVGPQVIDTVLKLLNLGVLLTNLGNALLVLIPKVERPVNPAQFRPISLLNVVFKIATKVNINHLKPILPTLISPSHAGFIPGR